MDGSIKEEVGLEGTMGHHGKKQISPGHACLKSEDPSLHDRKSIMASLFDPRVSEFSGLNPAPYSESLPIQPFRLAT